MGTCATTTQNDDDQQDDESHDTPNNSPHQHQQNDDQQTPAITNQKDHLEHQKISKERLPSYSSTFKSPNNVNNECIDPPTPIQDLQWESISLKDEIIKADSKWQQYADSLSNINNAKIEDLDNSALKKYGINDTEHRKQIYNIIQQIIADYKALKTKQCQQIRQYFLKEMGECLQNKTKQDLKIEAADEHCIGSEDMKNNKSLNQKNISEIRCEPLKRIKIILDIYNRLAHKQSLRERIPIAALISINDQYSHQQLLDDFQHIAFIHCQSGMYKPENSEKTLKEILCEEFMKRFKCDIQPCIPFQRHYRERNTKEEYSLYYKRLAELSTSTAMQIINDKDIVFQQECDKIHAYFLHPPEMNGYQSRRHLQLIVPITKTKKSSYIGQKEDEKWFRQISPIDGKETNKEIYRLLVQEMGVFRWQNAHGFKPGQNRAIAQLKPTYSNIKEEALYNHYHRLTKDNWNQTLRKAKVFYQSWVRQKIRTQYKGYFDDKVTGKSAKWRMGMDMTLPDVVTLKLYTDFDKLQFALKKCFRFETIADIVVEEQRQKSIKYDDEKYDDEKYDDEHKMEDIPAMDRCFAAQRKKDAKSRNDLEQRIKDFFHWRGGLMIILNKFGTKLNNKKHMILYHGVNTKMIISPGQTFGFYGPLSTTTSVHVANTFATQKGMVLKITSQFPRLSYCNAFDASTISDFPEEQEWLIGFMYVRVLEVRTRKLIRNPKFYAHLLNKIPLASWMRQEFFAIHLFREQMFSMSEHLERMQAQYLRVNRKECCKNKRKYQDKYSNKDYDGDWSHSMEILCWFGAKHEEFRSKQKEKLRITEQPTEDQRLDIQRQNKMYPIFWEKFEYFRKYPNLRQSIKFDNISDILKRFFMEQTDETDIKTKEKKWVISFDEITTVYPNVKEIHFLNQYKFDDHVLKKLIKQIEKGKNNKLMQVTFSYYDYLETNNNMPSDDKIFIDPATLDKAMLNTLKEKKWKIKQETIGQTEITGYKIIVYSV